MNTTKIGWIGLGNMGIPMAQQLINAAYQVMVYNRSKAKEHALKEMGATLAITPAKLIEQTDVVVIMVSDDEAINQVFTGENGLLAASVTGKIIVNMSTVSPGISKRMADACAEKGNQYLDAPVSGSVKQAETGQLIIMVGGEENAFENVKPVLEKLGKMSLFLGETGAGNAAKLAVNSLLAFYAQGLAESIIFANQNGIKTEDFLTIINNGAIANIFTKLKGDLIAENNFKPAFALKHIVKDLTLAKNEGAASPLASTALNTFKEAEEKYGEEDIIAVIKHLKN